MKEIIDLLKENPIGAFATIENGKPRVRPWGFMLTEKDRLYFCTGNTKEVYKQLKINPYMEFTSTSKDMITIRLSGEVVFTGDMHVKEEIMKAYPGLKPMYKSADNPIFEVFYLEHGDAIISDFSGNPPRKILF